MKASNLAVPRLDVLIATWLDYVMMWHPMTLAFSAGSGSVARDSMTTHGARPVASRARFATDKPPIYFIENGCQVDPRGILHLLLEEMEPNHGH